jgi:hypothetical protein
MFTEKDRSSSSTSSHVHLPSLTNTIHVHVNSCRTSSILPVQCDKVETISALKAKYTAYTAWLKTTNKHDRKPILTEELLKHSLCRMGIDSNQARQLVTHCKWYVYQFHRDLQKNREGKDHIRKLSSGKSKQSTRMQHVSDVASNKCSHVKAIGLSSSNKSKIY